MAGASNAHNQIATNTLVALATRLRGTACRAFNSDTKVRIHLPGQIRFYYPDVSVTCRPNAMHESFQDAPRVVVEVTSAEKRRIDEGEKLLAYQTIPSLAVYLIVEQDRARVAVFRRTAAGFGFQEFESGGVVPLPEIGCELPLAEVYDGVVATTGE
ncbi:MAG: Uma2 family endonuclease [Planctomycetes bacterium]|nr:Uma2 family endonuclease [Planctomycetota bacterium]